MFSADDTIAAIATARGAAGVAVIRISGPTAWDIARQLFSKPKTAFQPGRFYHGWLLDPWTRDGQGQPLPVDEVLLLIFKAPHSFTGDDVVEIHCHGGDFLSRRVLECLPSERFSPERWI
jgi:tRNA modification GTPase